MKKFFIIFLFSAFLGFSTFPAFAQSSYVLPYPSVMPGGINYKLHLVWERVMQYWYFGNFGQFEYNLKESDKYLVESKTLFEYDQFLLAYNALVKSNYYFIKIYPFLLSAQKEGKDISEKKSLFIQASSKHIEVLTRLKNVVPKEFVWKPERSSQTVLKIWDLIDKSIKERSNFLE